MLQSIDNLNKFTFLFIALYDIIIIVVTYIANPTTSHCHVLNNFKGKDWYRGEWYKLSFL